MLITKKKIVYGQGLTLYSKPMEKVKAFKYLGLWIDEKYTWKSTLGKYRDQVQKQW